MDIVKIDSTNIHLLNKFLQNELPSTFRYFSKRSVDCIKNHRITVVGIVESNPIAYGHIDEDSNIFWLGICVLKEYQQKGYGSKIITHMLNNINIPTIHLTVDKENISAIALYEKFGFMFLDEKHETYYRMTLNFNKNN